MRRCYREGVQEILDLEKEGRKNDPEELVTRLGRIEAHWDEIKALAQSVPKSEEAEAMLAALHGAKRPADAHISREEVHDAIRYAKELRNRYTVLQLMWDLGKLDETADILTERFC